ncbi:TMV resistance protein N-like [Pyrus ussuriensis x Pyrus communis]|uniref:TMV resistance protein N-like n=1 Tax=Pyrus ussuriensis x Pyrus communis TaxID=2448454 RepID=A0A5N5FBL4_9ROSA|nr:TMV resistance protein N-like [Pyrus ussuriensis x Pyrus communis]
MDTQKQIVVPVFYEVDPSDIRKLEGSFAEAFAKHESYSNVDVKEVQSWRSALARATDLSGWDSKNYKLIKIHCTRSMVNASWEDRSHPNGDCKQHMSGDLKFLSHELRCLLWHGCPLKSLPSNFHPKNLIDLEMPYSQIEQLWEGNKHLERLEFIGLSHSQYLNKTPDITEAKNLEILNLEGCTSLTEVHPSISDLEHLVFLSLKGCKELKILSSRIHMKSLKTLVLSGCSNFVKFPEISGSMQELAELYLYRTAIEELPSSISILTGLVTLNLNCCRELKSLPNSICQLKSLRYLTLSGCPRLKEFPEIEEDMEGLKELHLDGTSFTWIFPSIERLRGLVILNLKNSKSIVCLPDSICNLAYITCLTVSGCSRLSHLPEGLGNVGSLRDVDVEGSGIERPFSMSSSIMPATLSGKWMAKKPPFVSLSPKPPAHRHYENLVFLDLSDRKLLELPDYVTNLIHLITLVLCRNNFESLTATMDRLHHLKLEGCKRMKSITELSSSINFIGAHDCTALETLSGPKLLYSNLYFTFSKFFQLVQNLFEEIVEAHQVSLSLSLHVRKYETYLIQVQSTLFSFCRVICKLFPCLCIFLEVNFQIGSAISVVDLQ